MNTTECEGSTSPSLRLRRLFFANLTKTADGAGFGGKDVGTLDDGGTGAIVAGRV